ncbi:hypothetical protein [Marinicellulosiphila megalodicopiae]|uniref:hypothetical protein n=1 Tax=Marinicellulosiphila megalodicopiae TaxID=2724896 RepID=UPI003BB1C45C
MNDLNPGDILNQDVVMPSGRILMTRGMILTQSMIELVKKRNFTQLKIESLNKDSSSIVDVIFTQEVLVNDAMFDFKKYVQQRVDYYELI